jgi:hypothetical protein
MTKDESQMPQLANVVDGIEGALLIGANLILWPLL